jgi:hypothetical protein
LPDNAYISTLSIPGSHDTGTGNGFVSITESVYGPWGDKFARTQDISMQEQWEQGIRAFDLRPAAWDNYINVNHGIMPTKLHFDVALYNLRDWLIANPSEFAIIHLLHASEGDKVENVYEERLLELLGRDELKDFFVPFKPTLTVKEMRGKILLLSRDQYATKPIGGFLKNWTGSEEWYWQTLGEISGPSNAGTLYMQDYSDTHNEGGIDTKIAAMKRMLDYSTKHTTKTASDIVWVMNFASGYSKLERLYIPFIVDEQISSSDGYRDNATHTHSAILDYLSDPSYKAGPLGIVMMDYACVDWSDGYNTRGKELTDQIIANNFRYLSDVSLTDENSATHRKPVDMTPFIVNPDFNSNMLTPGWSGDEFGAVEPKENAEHYNHNFDTHQTITGLPNGVYAVGVKAFYRAGEAEESYAHYRAKDHVLRYARLYAVTGSDTLTQPLASPFSKVNVKAKNVGREKLVTDGVVNYYTPDDMESAEYYMHTLNAYSNKVFVGIDDHTLTLGVLKKQAAGTDWCVFDDFTLTYYGNQPEAYQLWLSEMEKMKVSYANMTVTKAYYEEYATANNATADNRRQAIAAMHAIEAAADKIALNAALWAEYKKLGSEAETLLDDPNRYNLSKQPLAKYMEQTYAKNLEELKLTNDQLRGEIETLASLVSQVLASVMPNTDVTNLYIKNADFTQGSEGWTVGTDSRPGIVFAEDIAEAYDTKFHLYQDVTFLQAGLYELKVQGFFRLKRDMEAWTLYVDGRQQSNASIYMDNKTAYLKCIFEESIKAANKPDGNWMTEENPGRAYPNDMATAAYAFGQGLYTNTLSILVIHVGQQIRIGIQGDMSGEGWACFDNLRLKYCGAEGLNIHETGIQRKATSPAWFTLDGKPVSQPQNHGLYLMRGTDGTVRKVLR